MRYYHTNSKTWKHLKPYARANRHDPTPSENILWQELRNSKLGFRFRRQHAMDEYIVDFVCISKNLVVEIDGGIHDYTEEYDANRTKIITDMGFKVIRFSNDEVINKLSWVLEEVKKNLKREVEKETSPRPSPKERE